MSNTCPSRFWAHRPQWIVSTYLFHVLSQLRIQEMARLQMARSGCWMFDWTSGAPVEEHSLLLPNLLLLLRNSRMKLTRKRMSLSHHPLISNIPGRWRRGKGRGGWRRRLAWWTRRRPGRRGSQRPPPGGGQGWGRGCWWWSQAARPSRAAPAGGCRQRWAWSPLFQHPPELALLLKLVQFAQGGTSSWILGDQNSLVYALKACAWLKDCLFERAYVGIHISWKSVIIFFFFFFALFVLLQFIFSDA